MMSARSSRLQSKWKTLLSLCDWRVPKLKMFSISSCFHLRFDPLHDFRLLTTISESEFPAVLKCSATEKLGVFFFQRWVVVRGNNSLHVYSRNCDNRGVCTSYDISRVYFGTSPWNMKKAFWGLLRISKNKNTLPR